MLPHALNKIPFVERFYSHHVTTSTNDVARAMKSFPGKGIFVIQADRQTAGRGRMGASFFSDSEGGLWASIITPISSLNEHFVHNRALSLAICDVVESLTGRSKVCAIKWPNDIYWRDKKFCGILLENHPARDDMLVIGFGINVSIKNSVFPEELQSVATSLSIETGERFSRSRILEKVIERYDANLALDIRKIHYTYSGRLYGLGCPAEIDGNSGVIKGVDIDGRLLMRVGHEDRSFLSGHLRFPKDTP
jgi:BirA family transcriptional regulator, biotin operon repressor / biotin---[acetyl-CoA-carboxylase] ligase